MKSNVFITEVLYNEEGAKYYRVVDPASGHTSEFFSDKSDYLDFISDSPGK